MTVDDDGVILNIGEHIGSTVVLPFLRTAYNYDMGAVSRETGFASKEPTLAQQQFKEECDINTIVERFGITGQMPQNLRMPIQEEFVETMTYHEALNKLVEADTEFMKLPASVRAEFKNDAGAFVEFASDEKNVDKMREWGMAMPATPAIVPAPTAPPAPIDKQ